MIKAKNTYKAMKRESEVYYNSLKGITYSVLVAYSVRSQADRIIEEINIYEKL